MKDKQANKPHLSGFLIVIFAALVCLMFLGCGGRDDAISGTYKLPGYINIQTFPMKVEDVAEVRNILLREGYRPIVNTEFVFSIKTHDGGERYLKGLGVSEEYPLLYWRDMPVYIEGRNITAKDIDNHERVCVLNAYDEDDLFGLDNSAIGYYVEIGGKDFSVVGVVEGDESLCSVYIPFTSAADIGLSKEYLMLLWIDDGRDLAKLAYEIHQMLKERGFSATVSFLNEEKEELGVFPSSS